MLLAWANVEQKSPRLAWLYRVQDADMPFWVGDGAMDMLPDEADGWDEAVLEGVVEFWKGAVELLDAVVPPGCCVLELPATFDIGGGT